MKTVDVTWRGTWGVGDFMWALNACHHYSWKQGCKINLEMHWDHGEDFLHHFEEEETIIERMNYIHNFYHLQHRVDVSHKFFANGEDDRYWGKKYHRNERNKTRFWFSDNGWEDTPGTTAPTNQWLFRKDFVMNKQFYDPRKVVIWRPLYNAQTPRTWKRLLTNQGWDGIIALLRQAGLHVCELTYRTPVSEAMFHIQTCRQVICYDGMWHYIVKNCGKPLTVVSEEGITSYHTPHALKLSHDSEKKNNIHTYKHNLSELLGESKKKAIEYLNSTQHFWEVDQ